MEQVKMLRVINLFQFINEGKEACMSVSFG